METPDSETKKRRVFIVDDNAMLREGLSEGINNEPDLMICGEAPSAEVALESLKTSHPDVVVVDISLEGKSGIELIKEIRAQYPSLPILVLTMHEPSVYAEKAFEAGAQGYVTKQESMQKVLETLRRVIAP